MLGPGSFSETQGSASSIEHVSHHSALHACELEAPSLRLTVSPISGLEKKSVSLFPHL